MTPFGSLSTMNQSLSCTQIEMAVLLKKITWWNIHKDYLLDININAGHVT